MGVYRRIDELTAAGERVALVTVTATDGSVPREIGTAMLVREDGSIEGTIGGGSVEERSREAAVEALESGEPRHETWELRPGGNTGMVCGGSMEVFINVLESTRSLVVAGGGHIAVPVVRMAAELGYSVTVVEDRESFADPDRFPEAEVIEDRIADGLESLPLSDNTAMIIATRSSALDRKAATIGLASDAFFVGCVASDQKAEHIRDGLRDDGVSPDAIDRLRSPVGLDIGADSPAEIALSILAEVETVRTGATGTSNSIGTTTASNETPKPE